MESVVASCRCFSPLLVPRAQRSGKLVLPPARASVSRNRVQSGFSGQQLIRLHPGSHPSVKSRRLPLGAARAHSHSTPSAVPPTPQYEDLSILDNISRFIYKKINAVLAPYLPKEFDYLDWLPESIHRKFHNSEAAAILVVRELLHFGLYYYLFVQTDGLCKLLHRLYNLKFKETPEYGEETFKTSNFHVLTAPIQLLIVVWAVTRFIGVCAPLLRIPLAPGLIFKTRETSVVVAVTWFCLKWKRKYVDSLTKTYKLDAPRIIAFDKVVSLILYVIALSCIGEVNGFALRSLLAVGGFSGVALGLAAKEIVSNFFGGALLFITRPFVIGERIKAGSFAGYVQDIGFLQTKLLSAERVPMLVPNQNFINQVITNYSRANNKLLEAEFPIRIQDIFLVDKITTRVTLCLKSHQDVDSGAKTPVCYLKSVHEQGVQLAVQCVVRPSGGSEFYRVQQAILIRVAEIIVCEGASLGSSGEWDPDIPTMDFAIESAAM
ncbi:hypothetical protein R1sor_022122 [Riccia sorocarpa]|uniref:Mechanosensitive ion channel MscS domain-containing protein n=1 Tax=Riccia sorocarpa TaxID=122646 RepID=A0ABD3GMS0_9MARC